MNSIINMTTDYFRLNMFPTLIYIVHRVRQLRFNVYIVFRQGTSFLK